MRNKELVLRDMISIMNVEPKRLQNMIDVSEERKRKIESLEERLRRVECAFFRERDEKVTELTTKLSNEEQKLNQLDRKFSELNTRYTLQGREFTEMSRSLHDVTYISGERFKKITNLEEQNKMLRQQVELFEGERTQLVEAAFKSAKETKQMETKFTDMEMQRNCLRDLLAKETDEKNRYYSDSNALVFYKAVSVIALLGCLVLYIL